MQRGAQSGADIHTVLTYVYDLFNGRNKYGSSSAVSVVVFAIILLLWIFMRRSLNREEGI